MLGALALGVLTLNTNGLSTEESYTKEFDSVKGQQVLADHGLADNSTPLMVVANAEEADDVGAALAGVETSSTRAEPVVKDGVAFITANLTVDATVPRPSTPSMQPGPRSTRSRVPMRWSADSRRSSTMP